MKKTIFIFSIIGLVAAMAFWAPERASAFPTWSADNTTNSGNCAGCHGDFQADGYVSRQDGTLWSDSLMDGHGNGPTGMGIACSVCHPAGFGAVMLDPGLDNNGNPVSSGVYLYRMDYTDSGRRHLSEVRKFLLMK